MFYLIYSIYHLKSFNQIYFEDELRSILIKN
jgi:hypothetical protein